MHEQLGGIVTAATDQCWWLLWSWTVCRRGDAFGLRGVGREGVRGGRLQGFGDGRVIAMVVIGVAS